ncbi:sugar phosphate isomerase/epimerase family protein [Kribbella sp. WER1]
MSIGELAGLGGRVLVLPSPRAVSPGLDRGELRELRAEAERHGISLEVSIGEVHPDRLQWEEKLALLAAGEVLGVTAFHTSFGVLADRLAGMASWSRQLEQGVPGLRELVARAERPVVMRTHEEMTTFELCRLAAEVPGLQVGFSPVNVVTRLEDPLRALDRVADLVRTVFVDDTWVVRTPEGLARRLRRIGDGDLPWPAIVARLADRPVDHVLDIHRAEFDMPVYDEDWLALQPDLDVRELVAVLRSARDAGEQTPAAERASWGRELLRAAGVGLGDRSSSE